MKVAMNSDKVALMESGWVASSALPNAYLRGMVTRNKYYLSLFFFFFFFAVFETFFDQPHYFRSKILPMKIIPAPSVCLPNENGGEKKDMI
jgi:hypothetical protein